MPSRIESIAETTGAAAEILSAEGFSEEAAFGIDMALREAVTNAVLHGNRSDETKLVEVAFTVSESGLVVTIRDQGTGFDPAAVPDPTAESNLLKPSGRGIMFMRTFMDEIEWSTHPGGGTVVRMVKRKI